MQILCLYILITMYSAVRIPLVTNCAIEVRLLLFILIIILLLLLLLLLVVVVVVVIVV